MFDSMPKHFTQRGFSLIEVLVAFVLLSFSLAVILQIFSGSLRNVAAARNYTNAMVLADAKLSSLGSELPIETGEVTGEDGDFVWRLSITPYVYPDESPEQDSQQTDQQLFEVSISVSWQQGARQPQVDMHTLRIGQAL